MSRKSLKTILKDIEVNLRKKDYVRNALSSEQTHIYMLDASDLTKEVLFDIRERYGLVVEPIQEIEVYKACEWYVETLVKAFQSNTFLKYKEGDRLKGGKLTKPVTPRKLGQGKYEVRFDADGGKIFRRIKDIKRTYNRLLERKVARAIGVSKDTFDSTGGNKSKGLIDVGHNPGYSIAETALSLSLGGDLEQFKQMASSDESIGIFLRKYGKALNPSFEIVVKDEGRIGNINTVAKGERGALTAVAQGVRELLSNNSIDWPRAKGSPSMFEAMQAAFRAAAANKKVDNKVSNTQVSSKLKSTRKTTSSKLTAPKMEIEREQREQRNWLSILAMINAKLPQAVADNMGSPRLNYRTGAFAKSVRATDITQTAQGYPSIGITYDKTPYGVFDRTKGAAPWNTPERDPHTLIEMSLRQIAQQIIKERFYVRRL